METATQKQTEVHHHKKYLRWSLRIVILAAIAWFISYSIEQYKKAEATEGIVVCSEEECILTTHIHADIKFDLCGNTDIVLPREHGALDGLHSHKEKNYLHFHDKIKLNTEKYKTTGERERLFDKRLSVQEVIDTFALTPDKYCGDDEIDIAVLVNDLPVDEGVQYNWKDGDDIYLIYRTRNQ